MKDHLRWFLYRIGDRIYNLASRLYNAPSEPDEKEWVWWDISASFYGTDAERDEITDKLMSVLCFGHDDGGHHVCARSAVIGSNRGNEPLVGSPILTIVPSPDDEDE